MGLKRVLPTQADVVCPGPVPLRDKGALLAPTTEAAWRRQTAMRATLVWESRDLGSASPLNVTLVNPIPYPVLC